MTLTPGIFDTPLDLEYKSEVDYMILVLKVALMT